MSELTKTEPKAVVATPTPMSMLQMAVEQGADLDKMQKLMDLQERWEEKEAKKAYTIAMSEFRANCPSIDKTRKGHNSKYAGLAETIEQIKIVLSDCGLSHAWKVNQGDKSISVTTCITHVSGHQECTTISGPADTTGSKTAIQSIGSTITYLERYGFFALLGLASKEQDDDGQADDDIPRLSEEQQESIEKLIKSSGKNRTAFLGWIGAKSLDRIRADQYDRCVAALEKKR